MCRMDVHTARLTTCVLVTLLAVLVAVLGEDEGREPPNLKEPLTSVDISETAGTRIVLTCSASGTPPPEYKWYHNEEDEPIVGGESQSYSLTDNKLIFNLSTVHEGSYTCRASNTFINQAGKSITAVTVSPKIYVQVAYLEDWLDEKEVKSSEVWERSYHRLECDEQRPSYAGDIVFVWVLWVSGKLEPVVTNERVFIDQEGTLHFTNVKRSDADAGSYSCGLSSSKVGKMVTGSINTISLKDPGTDPLPGNPVSLQFSSADAGPEALTFIRGTKAKLECVFSGYPTPSVKWMNKAGQDISLLPSDEHFEVANQVLTINNVNENDETRFTCQVDDQIKHLDVDITSPPIWVKRLTSTAVLEGRNAVLHCETKSMTGETEPHTPKWFQNMERLYPNTRPTKYKFTDGQRTLTVMDVKRDEDIACYQCFVTNHVGETFGEGCLNVLKPINITRRPDPEYTISKGDLVNLTVLATSDPLYRLSYEWIFKNKTYQGNDAPPLVYYNKRTRQAFINTSDFSDEQMKDISGVYTIHLFHFYESAKVDVDIRLQSEVRPAAAGFPFWIIGLIIGLLILIILIIICCCVICRRKMQEGDYPVDRKETAAGLDPEKEMKEGGFRDLSRAEDPNQNKKASHLDLDDLSDRDDESFGGTEYGEEATAFNEDGSFINAYRGKQKNPVDNPAFAPAMDHKVHPSLNPNESAV